MRKLMTLLVVIFFMVTTSYTQNNVAVKKAVAFVKTAPLSTISPIPPQDRDRSWKIMKKMVPNPSLDRINESVKTFDRDPVLQDKMGTKNINTKDMVNFEGVNNVHGYAPPDNMGDVGPSKYFQMINVSFGVFSKTGRLLYGPADNNTIWANLPGDWSNSNDGDPIVMYDELAQRWVVTQFALPNFPDGPFYELIAVSETDDPLGSWYLYAYSFDNMPDYPKFGVWPDAYYMSVNSFSAGSLSFIGAAVAAFDREEMLAGNPDAQMVFHQTSGYSFLPADLDGTNVPPAGTPGIFAAINENGTSDQMLIYNYMVDWTDPGSSVLVGPTPLPVEDFADVCSSRDCVPQAGTSDRLDGLSGRLMTRLQYRYFGENDARMVTNHTVDNGSGVAAVRWYELRTVGGNWSVYQQGTYSPDNNYRWMGSAAMDINGNIAIGYSVSSSDLYPEIRFTGRYVGDPLGELTIQEETIFAGIASQTGVNRWGDYTNMNVDPTDNVTFWYTNQYSNGGWDWGTRIAGFTFEIDEVAPDAITDLSVASTFSNTATLNWTATGDDGSTGTAARYDIRYSSSPIDGTNWDDATAVENDLMPLPSGTPEMYVITELGFGTTYYFAIKAIDNLGNESDVSNSPSGTTDNPPIIGVDPTSLSSSLFTGGSEETGFVISNDASAGSELTYLIGIEYPAPPKSAVELTPAQQVKADADINNIGKGIYPTQYVLASKDEFLLQETFENGVPPEGWVVTDNETYGVIWKTNVDWGAENKTGGTGMSATVDADAAGSGIEYDTELITPSINVVGRQDIYLTYKVYYSNLGSTDFFNVDISTDDGATWTTMISWNEDHTTPEVVTLLLDDYITSQVSAVKVRFYYFDTGSGDWNWDVQVDDVEIVGGSAWLAVSPTEGAISVGGSDSIDVTFSANGLVGGTYNANLMVVSNDPVNPSVAVACELNVTGVQNIVVDPLAIDFGTLFVNQPDSAVVTVSNTGTDDLDVTSLAVDNVDYTLSESAFVLTSGETKEVMVYFTPTHTGADNATLTINSDDPDEAVITVDLTGEGSDSPVAEVTPTSLSADLLTGQTQDEIFTVSNTSTTTSLLEYIVSIQYPGKNVVEKPLTKAQIEKSKNDINKIGNGIYPTLYALGTKDEYLLQEDFENGVPPEGWVVTDNETDGVIWKTNVDWGAENKTGGTGMSATVDADAAGSGIEYDTELITPPINVMGRQDIYLTYKAYYNNLGSTDFFNVDISEDAGATWTTMISWNEDHTTPEVVGILLDDYISATTTNIQLRFYYFDTGSGDWNWDVQIDDVEVVGGSAWLAVSPLSGELYNGNSQDHNVQFNAAGMFGGTYYADIVVSTNDPLNPAPAVACTLDVTGVQDIEVNPTTVDYGTIFVSGTDTATVNVANLGTDDLVVSGVTVDNTVFSVQNYNFTLAPGEDYDLVVVYAPTAAQTDNGTLTIASDDPDEPTFDVTLTGVAVNPPIIGVAPTSLSSDLYTGESETQTLTVSNTGEADLVFEIEVEETTAPLNARISKIHLPKSDGNFARGEAAPSFLNAPIKRTQLNSSPSIKDDPTLGYAAKIYPDPTTYNSFDITAPGSVTEIVASGSFFAGAISHDDPNMAYAIDYDNNHLYSIDIANAVVTDLGTVAGIGSNSATGMAFVGSTCFVAGYDGASSNLFTLDVPSATLTTVGTINAGLVIAIAADNEGNIYAHDLVNDILLSVDPSTGAGTEIGSTGFDANYAQGMGYDHANDVLYLAAYNNTTGMGELRVADTETGNTLAIGSIGAGDEYDMLSFMGQGGGNWLSTSIAEGTIPSGGSVDVDVTFNAEGLVGGTYGANIHVKSNDPVTPDAIVGANLTVTGAPNIETEPTELNFGMVYSGYQSVLPLIVSNTGTDDLEITGGTFSSDDFTFDPAAAFPVTLTSGTSVVWNVSLLTSASGAISGTLTIASNDANEPSKVIQITAEAVQAPGMSMDQTEISGGTEMGGVAEVMLTVTNTGGSDLEYAFEAEMLKKSNATTTINFPATYTVSSESAKRNITVNKPESDVTVSYGLESSKSTVELLILSPDTDEYITDVIAAMSAFDDLNVTQYPIANLATLTATELSPYDVVMVQNDLTWESAGGDPANVGNVLADYIDAGGKVVANMYVYSYDGWGMGGRFITEGYGPFVSTTADIWGEGSLGTVYQPGHPIMAGVNAINDDWGRQDPTVAGNAELIADWNDGNPMVAVNENVVGLNLLPINGNAAWSSDLATLLHNSVIYLGGSSWLTIEPASGTIAAGDYQEVMFTMNSDGMDFGTYYGTLHAYSNDPENPEVTMDITFDVLTGLGDGTDAVPNKYELSQNYPNPFNPSTNIVYALPVDSKVTMKIFDVLGREVTTLINKQVTAGVHTIKFNGINLTSGVYFYAIRAEGSDGSSFIDAKKFILMK